MKMLPMPALDFETYLKYSREILNMCASPSSTQGLLVELTRDIGVLGCTKGSHGIARPFNPLDIYQLINKYNDRIQDSYKVYKTKNKHRNITTNDLPDLSEAFDFFPYVTKDGKKVVSMFHTHITRFDFKIISGENSKK